MYFKCHVGLDFASSCRVKATTKTNIYDRSGIEMIIMLMMMIMMNQQNEYSDDSYF